MLVPRSEFVSIEAMADRPGALGRLLDLAARLRPEPVPLLATVPAPAPEVPRRTPSVSVIVPCYGYGRFLPDSVGSALAQQDVEVEVIVVDDASVDDSAAVADRFAAADSRVTVLRNDRNLGHVRTFNRGYERATGELIVRLDADDLLTPGSLARSAAVFEAHPEVGLVYGHPRHFSGAALPDPHGGPVAWNVWRGRDWLAERCRTSVNCITTPEAVIRATVMHEIGPLDTTLRFAQDMEMWLRTAAVSDVARVCGPDQALHREHATSMSVTDGAGELTDLVERRTVFDQVFGGRGAGLTDAADLHDTARRELARRALDRAVWAFDRDRTADEPVDGYEAFAAEVFPAWRDLPEARVLARRRRADVAAARSTAPFLARAARRRVRYELAARRWCRTGL